eukprot:TRINITY_DN2418_c0_g3_i2.p1 TRINITY_DN2418_c0_g3~~TRINITY_DN2418_c0_g3_i2.p1  ORF type:complete len:376 (-),score=72.80 TRINITY_DN2418_c0_g3_i2:39-1166(-)
MRRTGTIIWLQSSFGSIKHILKSLSHSHSRYHSTTQTRSLTSLIFLLKRHFSHSNNNIKRMGSEIPLFKGIWVATLTGYDRKTGKADVSTVDQYARLLEEDGVEGVFINGTSGESLSLTTEERKELAVAWKKAVDKTGKLKLIVHVGSTSVETARDLASHSESLGVQGISIIPPCFHKPANADAMVLFTKAVAEAAPKTPMIIYHFPIITGVHSYLLRDVFTKGKPVIPTLAGAKFTHTDLLDMERCIHHPLGPFSIFSGYDQALLPGFSIGAVSTIGISYNILASRYQRIIDLFKKGDIVAASKEQEILNKWYEVAERYGLIPAHKALLRLKGLDLGPVRLPLIDLTDAQLQSFLSELKPLEIFHDLKLNPKHY